MIEQLGQGDGLEEQHIALKRAEVDTTANIKCADVSAQQTESVTVGTEGIRDGLG